MSSATRVLALLHSFMVSNGYKVLVESKVWVLGVRVVYVRAIPDFPYRWPGGLERYEVALEYKVMLHEEPKEHRVHVCISKQRWPGKPHVVVLVDGRPVLELAPVKRYEERGLLITLIRRPDGKMYDVTDVPDELRIAYPIAIHREEITEEAERGFNKAAILVKSSDIDKMIELAIKRIRHQI